MASDSTRHYLIIRRDNLGDMLLTTPLLAAMKLQLEQPYITVFTNSYAAKVLAGNPDVDLLAVYTKHKHLSGVKKFSAYAQKIWVTLKLFLVAYEAIIVFDNRSLSLAKKLRSQRIIRPATDPSLPEAQNAWSAGLLIGLRGSPGPTKIYVDRAVSQAIRHKYRINEALGSQLIVGINISARRLNQKWPSGYFVELIRLILDKFSSANIFLFWAPGNSQNLTHPGDDQLAHQILSDCLSGRLHGMRTESILETVAGLDICHIVITPDGGALHIAAALKKPVVALFGDSNPQRWRPWMVPNRILIGQDRTVNSITPIQVYECFCELNCHV
jgi:heptosyltransferase-3